MNVQNGCTGFAFYVDLQLPCDWACDFTNHTPYSLTTAPSTYEHTCFNPLNYTAAPTATPTSLPTSPTASPTLAPTEVPTTQPTAVPTHPPTISPTAQPSGQLLGAGSSSSNGGSSGTVTIVVLVLLAVAIMIIVILVATRKKTEKVPAHEGEDTMTMEKNDSYHCEFGVVSHRTLPSPQRRESPAGAPVYAEPSDEDDILTTTTTPNVYAEPTGPQYAEPVSIGAALEKTESVAADTANPSDHEYNVCDPRYDRLSRCGLLTLPTAGNASPNDGPAPHAGAPAGLGTIAEPDYSVPKDDDDTVSNRAAAPVTYAHPTHKFGPASSGPPLAPGSQAYDAFMDNVHPTDPEVPAIEDRSVEPSETSRTNSVHSGGGEPGTFYAVRPINVTVDPSPNQPDDIDGPFYSARPPATPTREASTEPLLIEQGSPGTSNG